MFHMLAKVLDSFAYNNFPSKIWQLHTYMTMRNHHQNTDVKMSLSFIKRPKTQDTNAFIDLQRLQISSTLFTYKCTFSEKWSRRLSLRPHVVTVMRATFYEKNGLSLLLHYKNTLIHIYMIATLWKHYTIDLYFKIWFQEYYGNILFSTKPCIHTCFLFG